VAAAYVGQCGDAVAHAVARHIGPHFYDLSGDFVTEYAPGAFGYLEMACFEYAQIGSAYCSGPYPKQQVVAGNVGDRSFLQTHIANSVIISRFQILIPHPFFKIQG
jgi:hypothetical protein